MKNITSLDNNIVHVPDFHQGPTTNVSSLAKADGDAMGMIKDLQMKIQIVPVWATLLASPHSKVHGANMGPTWVLSAPDGSHVDIMNLAVWDDYLSCCWMTYDATDATDIINPIIRRNSLSASPQQIRWNV